MTVPVSLEQLTWPARIAHQRGDLVTPTESLGYHEPAQAAGTADDEQSHSRTLLPGPRSSTAQRLLL
jgi:hypothetical protein